MQPYPFVSESEYFELDARAPEGMRLEYFDGIVYCNGQLYLPDLAEAMAGETEEHSRSTMARMTWRRICARKGCNLTMPLA